MVQIVDQTRNVGWYLSIVFGSNLLALRVEQRLFCSLPRQPDLCWLERRGGKGGKGRGLVGTAATVMAHVGNNCTEVVQHS